MARDPDLVRAAGAVLVHDGRIALVHRPRYDDWSLPKGKLEPGEDDLEAAHREVLEETGRHGRVTADLGTIEYEVTRHGRTLPKTVRYYLMVDEGGSFAPHHEVDDLRWLPPGEAREQLSYDRDRVVLDRALAELREGS
jgi:8-oxo-dGTP pyrophosphatase MutT (NUDIX family)